MNIINEDYRKYILNMEFKDLVIIDPPWSYDEKKLLNTQLNYDLWKNNDEELDFLFKNIKCNYILMWVTNSFIYNVLRSNHYNFKYKTIVTWIKLTTKGNLFYGLGNNFRNCTEQLILFTFKKSKPLRIKLRNIVQERKKDRTIKPHNFEIKILDELIKRKETKFAYIFSGLDISEFEPYDIDLIDIELK